MNCQPYQYGVLFTVFAEQNLQTYYIYHWTSKILPHPVISKRYIVGGRCRGDRDGETETSLNYLSTCAPIHQSNSYIRYMRYCCFR